MKRKSYLIALFFLLSIEGFGQTDIVGPGRALQFDGIDDWVDLGNIYDDLTLPFTVSVWVYIDPATTATAPVLVSQDNNPIYNGFWFMIHPASIGIEYGDGRGENLPQYRRGKSAMANARGGRWTHVAAVMKGANDVDLYLNGVNVGGSYGGESNFPMASAYPLDIAKIGYFLSNGIIYRFKGLMDELRIYNRALSEAEIRSTMCHRLQGNETGLIGYWNFDEVSGNTLFDKSTNGFHGELKGNPTRVYSGAPVGDESVYRYSTNWAGVKVTKENGANKVEVFNANGTEGIHIYEVNHLPSQTTGLEISRVDGRYFGVFATSANASSNYDFDYTISGVNRCRYYARRDNTVSTWVEKEVPSIDETNRMEVIAFLDSDESFIVDLGQDEVLCDADSKTLMPAIDPSGKEFRWSTGEVSPSISVNESGTYTVVVVQGCKMVSDSISIVFLDTPQTFSLGVDEVLCEFQPRLLQVEHPLSGFEFTWQDNSSDSTFLAEDFGIYWLRIQNQCGVSSDSVTFIQPDLGGYEIPNVITANGDHFNQYFILHPILKGSSLNIFNRWGKLVFSSLNYQNDWDGGGLPSGVYYYTLSGDCLQGVKGVIKIDK